MLDNLKGELRIYVNSKEVKKGKKKETRTWYNACIASSKDEDDNYVNFYAPVNFGKKISIPDDVDSFDIIMKEGWLRCWKDAEGISHVGLFVNKAKVVEDDSDDKEDD